MAKKLSDPIKGNKNLGAKQKRSRNADQSRTRSTAKRKSIQ